MRDEQIFYLDMRRSQEECRQDPGECEHPATEISAVVHRRGHSVKAENEAKLAFTDGPGINGRQVQFDVAQSTRVVDWSGFHRIDR